MVTRNRGATRFARALAVRGERLLTHARLIGQCGLSAGTDYVDYGWIKLLYSGDGDEQELAYHAHCTQWYRQDMPVLSQLVKAGDTILDVGANLGFMSVMLARLTGPHGRVFAFEPARRTYAKLRRTIELNNLGACVTPINIACGTERGRALLKSVSGSSGNDSIVASSGKIKETIAVDTIDALCYERIPRVHFIKIDTEGFEPDVLAGAARVIERDSPIIYLEMGGDYLDSTQRSRQLLKSYGYCIDVPDDIDWNSVANGSNFVARPAAARRP